MNDEQNLKIFKALSEESRYNIIKVLLNKEECACNIPQLINRTQSNTSMHLAKLLDVGILESKRNGKTKIYSVKKDMKAYLKYVMEKS